MYSRAIRTHQKINAVAYRHLGELVGLVPSLSLKDIIRFDGKRGPDAPRLYKTDKGAPWHYYDPAGNSVAFLEILQDHYASLVYRLQTDNQESAAFEAAWLAHALVDGLTPPHHFPIEAELEDLHDAPVHARQTIRSHLMVKGANRRTSLYKSLRLSGPRGLLTAHTLFEANAGLIVMTLKLDRAKPSQNDLYELEQESFIEIFERYAREIDQFHMYRRFYKSGWTPKLTRDIRRELAPRMVRLVTLAWYSALIDAGLAGVET